MSIKVEDLGLCPYRDAWDIQKSRFEAMVASKREGKSPETEYIFLTEHPHVLTMGKHAHVENLLATPRRLGELHIECIRIERGGDITYHGPGQLVAYPIIDLEKHRLGVKDYVSLLEEAVIRTIARYGVKGERVEGASGVWIGKGTPEERKICALGVKCSRFVTMHGLALNVNTDLRGFSLINPCGFTDKGVTSLKAELNREVPMPAVKETLARELLDLIQKAPILPPPAPDRV